MTTYHETSPLVPEGENLRRAVRHVEDFSMEWTAATVSEVSVKFDLSPLQEDFLVRQFVQRQGIGA